MLKRRATRVVNHLNLHLAICNLIILLIYTPREIAYMSISTGLWHGGAVLCKMLAFLASLGFQVVGCILRFYEKSILLCFQGYSQTVLLFALDMWFCIVFPLKSRSHGTSRVLKGLYHI